MGWQSGTTAGTDSEAGSFFHSRQRRVLSSAKRSPKAVRAVIALESVGARELFAEISSLFMPVL